MLPGIDKTVDLTGVRIGWDLDGVLYNFVDTFRDYLVGSGYDPK